MAFHLENPVDIARNLLGDLFQRLGGADELWAGGVVDLGGADGEQDFGRKDEAVADDADVRVVAENVAIRPKNSER